MKNGFYFLGGLLLLAGACTAPDSYRLVGNLSGLADGTRMLLVPAATHKQEKPIGEAVVEDGKFVFEGQLPEPRLLNLQAEGKQLYYAFMLENGEVTITGEAVSTTDGDREMVTLNKAVVSLRQVTVDFQISHIKHSYSIINGLITTINSFYQGYSLVLPWLSFGSTMVFV